VDQGEKSEEFFKQCHRADDRWPGSASKTARFTVGRAMLHHMGTYLCTYSNWYLGTVKLLFFPVDGNPQYTQLYSLPHVTMASPLPLEELG